MRCFWGIAQRTLPFSVALPAAPVVILCVRCGSLPAQRLGCLMSGTNTLELWQLCGTKPLVLIQNESLGLSPQHICLVCPPWRDRDGIRNRIDHATGWPPGQICHAFHFYPSFGSLSCFDASVARHKYHVVTITSTGLRLRQAPVSRHVAGIPVHAVAGLLHPPSQKLPLVWLRLVATAKPVYLT